MEKRDKREHILMSHYKMGHNNEMTLIKPKVLSGGAKVNLERGLQSILRSENLFRS